MQQRLFNQALRGVEAANVLTAGYAHAQIFEKPTVLYEQDFFGIVGDIAAYMIAQTGITEQMDVPNADTQLLEGSTYQALSRYSRGETLTDLAVRARGIYDAMIDAQLENAADGKPIADSVDREYRRERPQPDNERLRELDALGNRELVRLHQAGDVDAGTVLLAHHRGMIWTAVNEIWYGRYDQDQGGISRDDLFQEGAIALLYKAGQFDPEQDTGFVGFYAPAVRGAIRRFYNDARTTVRIPRDPRRNIRRLRVAREQYPTSRRGSTSDTALAQELGLPRGEKGSESVNTIKNLRRYAEMENALPLDDVQSRRGMKRYETTPTESLTSESLPSPEDEVVEKMYWEEMPTDLQTILAELPERHRKVLELRYWRNMTFDEIGRQLGVTRSRAQVIHSNTLARLRHSEFRNRLPELPA